MSAILPSPKGWPSILLARAGAADPTDLDAALAAGAFEGLRRAVRELGPAGTIAEVEASGLRGRGGAGHLTAAKWRTAAGDGGEEPVRRRERLRRGPGGEHRPDARSRPIRTRSSRASRSRRSRSAPRRRSSRSAPTATEAIRRLEAAVDAATSAQLHRRGRARQRPPHRDRGPARPGRVHARRGDGPAEGPRRQARPARAAPAAPGDARLPQRPDGRPERADPRRRAVDPAQRREGVRGDRHRTTRPARSSSTSAARERAASPRSRSGRRSRDVVALGGKPGAGPQAQGRRRRRPDRRHPARRAPLDTPYTFERPPRRRRPRRLRLGDRRRRSRLRRRPRPAPDPLLRRRGVRQDHPVPDRRCGGSPRSASGCTTGTSRGGDLGLLDGPLRRRRRLRRCATTSAWRHCRC